METKSLLLFVKLVDSQFDHTTTYAELPGTLRTVVHKAADGLTLEDVYLLTDQNKQQVQRLVDEIALDYHHHAVTIKGERCTDPNCEEHGGTTILEFYANNTSRNRKPSGLN